MTSEPADRELDGQLARRSLAPQGFVLVNPFSRWPSKAWPLDRCAAVERVLINPAAGAASFVRPGRL